MVKFAPTYKNFRLIMQPLDPMEHLLEQLSNLMKFAQKNASKPLKKNNTANLQRQLELLEDLIAKFNETTNKELLAAGVTDEELKKKLDNPEQIPPKVRRFLERSVRLQIDATLMRDALKVAITRAALGLTEPTTEAEKKKRIQKRKKKFKRMGGDTNWKPL